MRGRGGGGGGGGLVTTHTLLCHGKSVKNLSKNIKQIISDIL